MKIADILPLMGEGVTRHQVFQWWLALRNRRAKSSKTRAIGTSSTQRTKQEYSDDDVEALVRVRHALKKGYGIKEAVDLALETHQRPQLDHAKLIAAELVAPAYSQIYYSLVFGRPEQIAATAAGRTGFDTVASSISEVLNAARAGIYVPHHSEHTLVLVGESKHEGNVSRIGFRIDRSNKKSLTARVACTRKPLNLFGPKLAQTQTATHLSSPRQSILLTPLVDRKNGLVAVIKVENKHAPPGMPFGIFDSNDEALLATFGSTLVPLIELYRWFVRGASFLSPLTQNSSLKEIGGQLLAAAVRITGADLGEVTRAENGQLSMEVVFPETNTLKPGSVLEFNQPSITYRAFGDRATQCEPDVSKAEHYYPCNPETKSEIAVPIQSGQRIYGVLNVESRLSGPAGLNTWDIPMLESLASLYGIAAEMRLLRDCLSAFLVLSPLEPMIEQLNNATGKAIQGCVICRVNHSGAKLEEVYRRNAGDSPKYECPFSQRSLLTKVFLDESPYFSRYPKQDPNVWTDCLAHFGINASLLGVPIVFEELNHSIVIGVFMAWNDPASDSWTSDQAAELIRACQRIFRIGSSPGGSGLTMRHRI